jgi:hypothetical protein
MGPKQLYQNVGALTAALLRAKPDIIKGRLSTLPAASDALVGFTRLLAVWARNSCALSLASCVSDDTPADSNRLPTATNSNQPQPTNLNQLQPNRRPPQVCPEGQRLQHHGRRL